MTSQEKGAKFEKAAREYFVWLFEEIGFIVSKDRIQFSGTQDGFDIQLIVVMNNFERAIYIECKNYSTDLDIGNILKKAWDLEKNYHPSENDLFISILPKTNFKNADNSEKSSPVLNEKFNFKSYQLDKSNGIQELFALNEEFYKEIYGLELDFEVDKLKEIEKFKSIIYSRKPFKKIFLSEHDKVNFIADIELDKNYVNRYISADLTSKNEEYSLFKRLSINPKSLDEVLLFEDKVLVLGNPGLGKSTELKEFAISKWKVGEQNSFTPIFRNLKNFTQNHNIEDFLPTEVIDLQSCYIIFDGIDEIKDPQDFISKLEVFIDNNSSKQKKYKFVLSCRTNIYESIIKTISGFKAFYLNNLSHDEAFGLLSKQLENPSRLESLSFKRVHYDFLKNPFLIGILAEFINKNNNLPQNSTELWENYITKRLEFDNKTKLVKLDLNTPLILKLSKKTSLISELMKINSLKEAELLELTGENLQAYLKNPLIEKDISNNTWYFEHRNIQEYFAAKQLSELSCQNIIDFISITDNIKKGNFFTRFIVNLFNSNNIFINKTHPSLFNTITFLINILDNKKREELVKWLEENDEELLFTADSDRLSPDVKIRVLQNYFKKTCIENTFWISHSGSFSVDIIGKFGDCEENFMYLLSMFENKKNHFRIIISALDLLANMTLPDHKVNEIKALLLSKLKDHNLDSTCKPENDLKIKSNIITCIQSFNLHNNHSDFLEEILEVFKNERDKQINQSLLYLIASLNGDVDNYFQFIYKEFLRAFKFDTTEQNEKYVVNSTFVIEEILLRIKSSDNFLKIVKCFLNDNNYGSTLDKSFATQLFEKCNQFSLSDHLFIDKILDSIKKRKDWHSLEHELVALISLTNSNSKAIEKFITDDVVFNESRYLVARLVSEENISIIINKFTNEKADDNDVEIMRNIIGNTNSKDLAIQFEKLMTNEGYIFKEKYLTQEELEKNTKAKNLKKQHDFDILFDIGLLSSELKKIYDEISLGSIDWETLSKYQTDWYSKNDYSAEPNSATTLLVHLVRDNGKLTYEDVVNLIKDEFIIMSEVKRHLKSNFDFNIAVENKNTISEWCLNSVEKIDYNRLIISKSNREYSVFRDYYVCKNIFFFQKKLDIQLPQTFYTETLRYCDFESFNNQNSEFDFNKGKISNKATFDELITNNINNYNLHSTALRNHILYAIDNNLTESFEKIKYHFINDSNLCFQNESLQKFFSITKDVEFLIKCCEDINSFLCWESIGIIIKNNLAQEFALSTANKYLLSKEETFMFNALGILFKYNQPEALEIFYDFVKNNLGDSIKQEYYINYDNERGIKMIAKFYSLLYQENTKEDIFKNHYAKELIRHYINMISGKSETTFKDVQGILNKIKRGLKKRENEMFYINVLITDSKNSFINFKSRPMEFVDAKAKVDKL
ncbi:NACHT domain-containing NTPase [Flavobacterium sp. 102]|uniref:NACHT domain-containing protein n=1 Tax=Flavobacterium sp. 102 TaxID=2135623 RepID=UPI000EAE747B|nr:hypothetical protein [Flavobacterium sp. 102]RKS01457.1 hypothetical protein C8C84_1117 [Flavobacterium sp. 102]